jgi:hypothetical protein
VVERRSPLTTAGAHEGLAPDSANLHAAGRAAYQGEKSLATAPVKQIMETRAKRPALGNQRTL